MANRFLDTDLVFTDEDLASRNEELSVIKSLTNEELAESLLVKITVCYALCDISETQYGFGQSFCDEDTLMYFTTMMKFANNTLGGLLEHRYDYHLYKSEVKGNLFRILKSIYPQLTEGVTPDIYHFSLYTSKGNADRKTGIRSPRVYFVLADYGRIYPLFFDPYHELNPINTPDDSKPARIGLENKNKKFKTFFDK